MSTSSGKNFFERKTDAEHGAENDSVTREHKERRNDDNNITIQDFKEFKDRERDTSTTHADHSSNKRRRKNSSNCDNSLISTYNTNIQERHYSQDSQVLYCVFFCCLFVNMHGTWHHLLTLYNIRLAVSILICSSSKWYFDDFFGDNETQSFLSFVRFSPVVFVLFSVYVFTLQASSQSSFKLSPLPKLNQEADESRRNSPANQQSVLNIKQELLDMGTHANLPQELIPVSTFICFVYIHSLTYPPHPHSLTLLVHIAQHFRAIIIFLLFNFFTFLKHFFLRMNMEYSLAVNSLFSSSFSSIIFWLCWCVFYFAHPFCSEFTCTLLSRAWIIRFRERMLFNFDEIFALSLNTSCDSIFFLSFMQLCVHVYNCLDVVIFLFVKNSVHADNSEFRFAYRHGNDDHGNTYIDSIISLQRSSCVTKCIICMNSPEHVISWMVRNCRSWMYFSNLFIFD